MPDLLAKDTTHGEMVDRLFHLTAEGAVHRRHEATPPAMIRCPASVLDHKPEEELVLTRLLQPPYLFSSEHGCLP
jgi:hypothetical protein